MIYPWEFNYSKFMDTHIRVSVTIDGQFKGSYAILDEGLDMNVETIMPDGASLVFKVESHPRTTDQRMTATELISYLLEHYR